MTQKILSMTSKLTFWIRRLRRDRRGSVGLMLAASAFAIFSLGGLITQEAMLFRVQRAVQASTNLAALAGAQDINCCSSTPGKANTTAASYTALNPVSGQTLNMATGYPQLKCLTSTGVSCAGPDSANAIVVKQEAAVPLLFGSLFGKSSATVSATATASSSGGKALDVMLVLDTTASMNNTDANCSVSGSRLNCAASGARELLKKFQPSLANVGLMVFPGLKYSDHVPRDYDCSNSPQPTIAKYSQSPSPFYQILGLSSDYKTSDTAAFLNTGSNLVKALKGGASGCKQGVSAVGGVGTYYADVVTAAQTYLTGNGRSGVQKAIIFLSDGDANASSSNMLPAKVPNQCHQAITAAQAASAAGTLVYTLAYGASTSAGSSCSTDSPQISACSTLEQMASSPANFFSDNAAGCSSSLNSVSELVSIFSQVGTSLSSPRLLPNNAT
ncbi:MAG: hypothetical protein L0Y57_06865 [Beijerinckiaceae bacterium]|nr:hypothetical protein [Beijerinckiaceae bacterium]